MGYPKHPETVVIENEFYPDGLHEIDIWNHYQKYKTKILKEVQGRDLFFVLMVDSALVYRRGEATRFVRLNPSNYDKLITGRTLSIHSTMRRSEDIAVVDIDAMYFPSAKKATVDVYNFMEEQDFVSRVKIRFTGKSSFHVFCDLKVKSNVDILRRKLKSILEQSDLSSIYSIDAKRKIPNVTNLDLAPMKFRGGFVTLHSLSLWGLKCTELSLSELITFEKEDTKIK